MTWRPGRKARGEEGAVAVVVALCSILLFSVSALAVDVGQLYEVRRGSQTTADLAALAGAAKLPDGTEACKSAVEFLQKNKPTGEAFATTASSCSATGTPGGEIVISERSTRIRVLLPQREVGFGFAGVMGFGKGYTGAFATAEIRSPGGLTPFAVSTTLQSGLQCIKDNTNGQNRPLPPGLVMGPAAGTTVDDYTPKTGPVGETTTVTFTGDGLNGASATFDGVAAATVSTSKTQLVVLAPARATAGVVPVTVKGNGGNAPSTNVGTFTYAFVQPTVSQLSPNTDVTGAVITVLGQHFAGVTGVSFGGTAATAFSVTSSNQLQATVPAGATGSTVDVRVTNPAGQSANTNADNFTYAAPAPPTVTGVSPGSGSTLGGTVVTITGTGLTGATQVTFGGTPATTVTPQSATSLSATAPPHAAGQVSVLVTTPTGTSPANAGAVFTYGVAPTVTGLLPDTGLAAGGTPVVVTGTGFSPGVNVFFGGNAASSVLVLSPTQLTATSPAGNGTVDVRVVGAFGTSANTGADDFTYFADECGATTGNFGYLDIPRSDATSSILERNVILGMDHRPAVFPSGQLPPLDTQCKQGNAAIPGAVLDNPPSTVVDGVNCLDVQNGNKVSAGAQAFLDGIGGANGLDPRLLDPAVPPNDTSGSVAGRPAGTLDNDAIEDFLVPGQTLASFLAALATEAAGGNVTTRFFDDSIADCPRFSLLPVLHISGNQQNGLYPVVGFVGSFVKSFQQSNNQVKAIQSWVFPLEWLPPVISGSEAGSIPFIGSGPVTPLLVE